MLDDGTIHSPVTRDAISSAAAEPKKAAPTEPGKMTELEQMWTMVETFQKGIAAALGGPITSHHTREELITAANQLPEAREIDQNQIVSIVDIIRFRAEEARRKRITDAL